MKKFVKQLSKQNINEVRQELSRAHLIIMLLSLVSILLLMLGSTLAIEFDLVLSIVASVLLAMLAVISAYMSIILRNLKKK